MKPYGELLCVNWDEHRVDPPAVLLTYCIFC